LFERGFPFEVVVVVPALPGASTVTASNTVRFEDVLVGEVWLCSGQSNMEMGVRMCANGAEEIANAKYPGIRLLLVPNRWSPEPQTDMEATGIEPRTPPEGFAAGPAMA
jgi:sialate O-acetylesterase